MAALRARTKPQKKRTKKTTAKKTKPTRRTVADEPANQAGPIAPSPESEAADLVATLQRLGTERIRSDMAERYGIRTPRAFGVPMGKIQALAKGARSKRGGPDHDLAAALWETGWYEARMLACLVDDPARVTVAQMDRWCRDFDNWGICDTACFHLFDRTPLAWGWVEKWCTRKPEFEKRAAFALLASLALHDKQADHGLFLDALPLIERGAADDRNFVKKAVSWALRSIGERSAALHASAIELATRLADGPRGSAERWVGTDALRGLRRAAVVKRVAKKPKP